MKKFYAKLKASLAKTAGLLMLLMAMLAPLGAWGQVTILSENFDECTPTDTHFASLPTDWSTNSVGWGVSWLVYDGNDGDYDSYTPNSSPYSVWMSAWGQPQLDSKPLNTSGYSNIKLSFAYLNPEVWGAYTEVKVLSRLNSEGEWSEVVTLSDGASSSWRTISNIILPDGVYQIAFTGFVPDEDNGANFVAIDDIVITGIPAGGTAYAINITDPITGGSVTSNPATQAYENSTVTLTAAASTGYTFNNIASNWSVVDGSSNPITVTPTTDNKATFTMPGSAVTVSATFTALTQHSITCNTPTGGTVSTYPTQAYMGDQVNIYAYPTSGYTLTALTATYTDEYSQPHDLGVTTTNTTFTMPDYDVTVNATFEAADMSVTIGGNGGSKSWVFIHDSYQYSLTQSIYEYGYFGTLPEDGIMIKKISIWSGDENTSSKTFTGVKIYMTTTSKSYFYGTGTDQYIHLEESNEVFSGSFTVSGQGQETEITLDTPYLYDGDANSNLVVCVRAENQTHSVKFRTFALDNHIRTWKDQVTGNIGYYTPSQDGDNSSHYQSMKFSYVPVTSKAITKVETNCNISTKVNNVEVTRAEPGETVALAYSNVATHYTFNSWNVHQTDYPYTAVTVTNNSFTMPGYAVTVEAVLDEETKYDVEFAELEHGYFGDYSGTSFYAGSEVYFAVNPYYGYNINTVTVTDEDEGNVDVHNYYENYYYFNMPGKNVTVNATFTEKASNNITINKIGGNELCTVTASVGNPVYQGTNVTLNVNEPEGYSLSSLSASYNDGENDHDLGVTTSNRSFTMPAYPVTVNAEFAGMLEIGHVAATSKTIVIKMYDSYGDGWNGNYLTVSYNDGTSSENLQLNYGSSAQYTRTLNPGVTMTVSYVKGPGSYTYPSENSFTVEYQGGAMIYQSSGTPSTGTGCDITNPDNSTVWLPVHRDNYYSMSEMIYNHSNYSSLEGGIIVSKINFWTGPNNNSKTYNDVKVYMKATSYDNFTQTDYIGFTNADLVFEGSFTAPASNNARIDLTLDTPFRLSDINQNIVIGVYSEGNNPGSTYPVKFNSFEANNCGSQWNQWISNIETYNPGSGSICNSIPALGLTYGPIPSHNISYMEPVALGSISGPATATEGAVVTLVPSAATGYVVDVITVTKSDESGTCDVNEDYQFTMPTCNVSVSATFKEAPACVATFHVNGLAIDKETKVGIAVSIPEVSVPAGYTFYGWTNAEISSSTTTAPAKVAEPSATEFVPTGNCDIYAVFAKAEVGSTCQVEVDELNNPVNSNFSNGGKYILATYYNAKYYALYISQYGGVYTGEVTVTKDNNILSVSDSEKILTATQATDGVYNGFTFGNENYILKSMGDDGYFDAVAISTPASASMLFDFEDSYKLNIRCRLDDYYYIYFDNGYKQFKPHYWSTGFYVFEASVSNKYYTYIADAPINNSLTINGNASVTNPIIIGPTAVVTVTGTLTNNNPANIIIQDGGELILAQGNTGVMATVEKNIEAITSSKEDGYDVDKWYTIGSSVNTPIINGSTGNYVANIIPASGMSDLSYNLYYLDMTKELPWINYRQGNGVTGFNQLENGLGYLYSNQAATTIEYVGELNTANVNRSVNEGWNLVSNPFAQTIAFNRFVLNSGSMAGYYSLDGTGGWQSTMLTADVKNNQGILVNVPAATTMTISRPQNDGSKGNEKVTEDIAYIEINVANANYSDRAYAAFTEGYGLPKYNHQNAEIQKVYIPQNGENFAIATMDESITLFPVNFKAMTTGYYTISLKSSQIYEGYNDFDYLHLIDNMTGEEIDMLLEDGYKFVGSPRDNENRFTVKLHRNGVEENEAEDINFVYQNGNSLVINGEGTFQLIDMLGRVVIGREIHGETVSVDNLITGAYIVRMIGNEVKTQKIVIK